MEGITVGCEILLEDLGGGAHWEVQWVSEGLCGPVLGCCYHGNEPWVPCSTALQ